MTDFLWHKVSDKEKEEIKKQAKQIMDSFSKKLSSVDSKKLKEFVVERDKMWREEGTGVPNELDRKIMFENAPEKNSDFIIAEKKRW